jgi:L-asparaginase
MLNAAKGEDFLMHSGSKEEPPYPRPQLRTINLEDYMEKFAAKEKLPGNRIAKPDVRRVYVLTTGGTMEKIYSEQTGSVTNTESKIDRYLRLLRLPETEVNVVPLMNKDSLEMTDQDRVLILGMVRAILKENAPIVITHGTDTMVQTGLYLQRALGEVHTPIVLTGAMTPLGFEGSDGLQNLTESLLAVQSFSLVCTW